MMFEHAQDSRVSLVVFVILPKGLYFAYNKLCDYSKPVYCSEKLNESWGLQRLL